MFYGDELEDDLVREWKPDRRFGETTAREMEHIGPDVDMEEEGI